MILLSASWIDRSLEQVVAIDQAAISYVGCVDGFSNSLGTMRISSQVSLNTATSANVKINCNPSSSSSSGGLVTIGTSILSFGYLKDFFDLDIELHLLSANQSTSLRADRNNIAGSNCGVLIKARRSAVERLCKLFG